MKKIVIDSIYDGEKGSLPITILEPSEKINLPLITIVNVLIIDSSILNEEEFLIDGDIYSISSKDLFNYLDVDKTYIFIESDGSAIVVEYNEDRLLDILYLLAGTGIEFYVDSFRKTNKAPKNYFY